MQLNLHAVNVPPAIDCAFNIAAGLDCISDMNNDPASSMSMALRLAQWVEDFAGSPMSAASLEHTRLILLDSLGCALHARNDETARAALAVAAEAGRPGLCSLIGTADRTSLPLAAFANGVLIRTLDLNDTYVGPRQVGHPSDNIGAALAGAEASQASGDDLMRAIRMGYEIYGRILDLGNPESPWDHVTVSGIVSAAMLGWLLRLPREQLAHAVALAATHCATLGEVRVGHVSAAKSMANAVVVQTAALMILLAAQGMTGPARALEGDRGYASLILEGIDFGAFFETAGPQDRILERRHQAVSLLCARAGADLGRDRAARPAEGRCSRDREHPYRDREYRTGAPAPQGRSRPHTDLP